MNSCVPFASSLRIELAQYREMAVFSRFGSDLDKSTRKMLESGERLTMLLTQGKHELYSLSEQTALLLLFKNGRFDDVPPREMNKAAHAALAKLHASCPEAFDAIDRTGDLPDDVIAALLA